MAVDYSMITWKYFLKYYDIMTMTMLNVVVVWTKHFLVFDSSPPSYTVSAGRRVFGTLDIFQILWPQIEKTK